MPGFITIEDARRQVVVEDDSDDALLQDFIDAAAHHIESRIGFVADQREHVFTFDRFTTQLELRLRPVDPASIEVSYLDGNGDEQSFTDLRVIDKNGTTRILPAIGFCWPTPACGPAVITVAADVGFTTPEDNAPETLRQATRLCVGSWFADREVGPIPEAACTLIEGERARRA